MSCLNQTNMDVTVSNLDALPAVARQLLASLSAQTGATVVALTGDLGAGKTTLVKALALELGITEEVSSPTFIVARYYDVTHHPYFDQFIHMDVYRLTDPRELDVLRWDVLLRTPRTLIVVEWGNQVASRLPPETRWIHMTTKDETTRHIFDATVGA